MANHPQFAGLPILAGPYSRRRLVRFRAPVRQFSMITVMLAAAAAALWALIL
jgi:hypothetical protein